MSLPKAKMKDDRPADAADGVVGVSSAIQTESFAQLSPHPTYLTLCLSVRLPKITVSFRHVLPPCKKVAKTQRESSLS